MANKVHVLPPEVVSKIAAGEVIERPASVVKEILENALDAGSDSIEIQLEEAGKSLIRLCDNGAGIDKEDLSKIFQRHSTSKITSFDDLFKIDSLGFRGEALYSIAAVADVVLRSKTKEQESGWEIHIRGGKEKDHKPVSMNEGTEIEIRELFFNTPARKKFLKSNTTELNQILNIVIPHSLLYNQCRLTLTHKKKEILNLLPANSQKKRMAKTLNFEEDHIVETEHYIDQTDTRIKMFLGDINLKRSTRDMQFVFVNGRPVQSKTISFHMNQVYQLLFPPKTHPVFAVFINVPPDIVDINIHPTKREVKIKNENNLGSILRNMAEQALMSGSQPQQVESPESSSEYDAQVERALRSSSRLSNDISTVIPTEVFEDEPTEALPPASEPYSYPQEEQQGMFEVDPDTLQSKMKRARYIGAFMNKFLLFESGRSLMIVDQHAAQERIVYEQLCRQIQEGKVEVQRLLAPITISLSPQELQNWEEAHEKLNKFGFESNKFDETTIAVHTYPNLISEPAIAVQNLLIGDNIAHCDHTTIARRACKASVRAGDTLNKEQADYQREQLLKCRDPFTCPHGRPTVIEMSEDFLDKNFLRT